LPAALAAAYGLRYESVQTYTDLPLHLDIFEAAMEEIG
jgi:hypothetical protein